MPKILHMPVFDEAVQLDILTRIESFHAQCQASESTDSGDVWDLLNYINVALGGANLEDLEEVSDVLQDDEDVEICEECGALTTDPHNVHCSLHPDNIVD